MSLTAEIKINGRLIKHLYVINTGPIIPQDDTDLFTYEFTAIDVISGNSKRGAIVHHRRKGAVKLVEQILKEI